MDGTAVVLAQADGNGQPAGDDSAQQPNPWAFFIMFGVIFLIFWFVVIRPQKKEEARHQDMLKNLEKNDKVVTAGGIVGTVVRVKEEEITLRIDDKNNVRVKLIPSRIIGLWQKDKKTENADS